MSRKKAIELLENIIRITNTCPRTVSDEFINRQANEALALLQKQPPAGEFTKEWRKRLKNTDYLYKISSNWYQSAKGIMAGFSEACVIIDQQAEDYKSQAAEIKQLKDGLIAIRKSTEIMEARRLAEDVLAELKGGTEEKGSNG